jgi:hypothetical protein
MYTQAPKYSGFDKDLGLDLLMNPRKKNGSDASSVGGDDRMSVRSGSIRSVSVTRPAVINVADHMKYNDDDDGEEDESEVSFESDEIASEPKFQQRKPHRPLPSERDSSEAGSQMESIGIGSIQEERGQRMTDEEIIIMKKELIYQFERLEKKGMRLPKKFTLASNLEEMKMEYERLKRDKEVDSSVKFQRRIMMAGISGLEWLNGKFDPVGAKLDGWSDSIYENIDEYDEVFEDLHEKYKGKAQVGPEVKLLMMLGGSAFMHHMTHSMFKTQLPGLDEILKQNPELAKNLASATSQHMANQQSSAGNLFGGLGNMFSGMFGGGGVPQQQSQYQAQQQQHSPPTKVSMKGPSGVEELMREFEMSATFDNDRIETMSAITESDIGDLDDDASSINGILMGKKKKPVRGKGKRTLDI